MFHLFALFLYIEAENLLWVILGFCFLFVCLFVFQTNRAAHWILLRLETFYIAAPALWGWEQVEGSVSGIWN